MQATVVLLMVLVCAVLWHVPDSVHRHSDPDGVVVATDDAG